MPRKKNALTYYHICAIWDENDSELGTWTEVIAVAPDKDPYEVAKDTMLEAEPESCRDSIMIVDCTEVSGAVDAILCQIPASDAKKILRTLLRKYQ